MKKFAEHGAQNEKTGRKGKAAVWPYIIKIMIFFGRIVTDVAVLFDNLPQRFRESSTDGRRR
jgi:hypothetical protein